MSSDLAVTSDAELRRIAAQIRAKLVEMSHASGAAHLGSSLSCVDILVTAYWRVLNIDPACPDDANRDRLILSKGHAGACIYAALAERGFFSTDVLDTHYQDGSKLSGHVSHKGVSGVDLSTGSLGHGLPVAAGAGRGLPAPRGALPGPARGDR